jgi:arsenate reductase
VHPYAARVMQEVGLDITGQRPKPLSHVPLGDIDTVITLCDDECPIPPADRRRREEAWHLTDPSDAAGGEQEMLLAFRRVRDEIKTRVEQLVR